MSLVDPQGIPLKPKLVLDEQDILRAFTEHRVKLDGLGQQALQQAILTEFMIERMNAAAETGNLAELNVSAEDFQKFYEERTQQIQAEMKEQLKRSAGLQDQPNLKLEE